MESKFDEVSLLIEEHDDMTGIDNVLEAIKRATIVARAPEPLRTGN